VYKLNDEEKLDMEKLDMSEAILPKRVGRPPKAERDRGISIFLNQSGFRRIRAHAARLRDQKLAAGSRPVGINAFHSAALRDLIEWGWPDAEETSNKGHHPETNLVVNFYMSRAYLAMLDDFVQAIKDTGKNYNRSTAVRDLIDLHLP